MKKYLFIIATFILYSSNSIAQDCNLCNAALTKDRIEHSVNIFESIYYFEQISESEYIELKKEAGLGVKIPIPIIGEIFSFLTGSANYENFEKRLKEFKKTQEQKYNYQINYNATEVRTNPIVYNYWSKCMENCMTQGLLVWKDDENTANVVVGLRYVNPPGISKVLNYTLEVRCEDTTYKIKGKLLPNGNDVAICPRKFKGNRSEMIISVKTDGGYSKTIKSTYHLSNENPIRKITLVYDLVKEVEGLAQTSPDLDHKTIPNAFRKEFAGRLIPTNSGMTLPFPVSCGGDYYHTYLELSVVADEGFTLQGTPSPANLHWISGSVVWNSDHLGNGSCPGHGRPMFFIPINKSNYKLVYVNIGSSPTTVALRMRESKTYNEEVPFFETNSNETIFSISKKEMNNLKILVEYLKAESYLSLSIEDLKLYAEVKEFPDSYLVKISNTQRQALKLKYDLK